MINDDEKYFGIKYLSTQMVFWKIFSDVLISKHILFFKVQSHMVNNFVGCIVFFQLFEDLVAANRVQ